MLCIDHFHIEGLSLPDTATTPPIAFIDSDRGSEISCDHVLSQLPPTESVEISTEHLPSHGTTGSASEIPSFQF